MMPIGFNFEGCVMSRDPALDRGAPFHLLQLQLSLTAGVSLSRPLAKT